MKTAAAILVWLLCLSCLPSLAADAPFKVSFRQQNVVQGDVATTADLLLSVENLSGTEARDVTVSAVNENSFYVINIPIPFGDLTDGLQKELLVPAVVPNISISDDTAAEEVIWKVDYVINGETASVEVVGEKGL